MKKQTAVEWLVKIYLQTNKIDSFDIEQAKQMEKRQIIDAHLIGLIRSLEMEATKQATEYFDETYGSKGSDDLLTEEEIAEFKRELKEVMKKPKTEISDEEYYKDVFYQKQVMNPYPTGDQSYTAYEKGFMDFAKWYREQLKKKI